MDTRSGGKERRAIKYKVHVVEREKGRKGREGGKARKEKKERKVRNERKRGEIVKTEWD